MEGVRECWVDRIEVLLDCVNGILDCWYFYGCSVVMWVLWRMVKG